MPRISTHVCCDLEAEESLGTYRSSNSYRDLYSQTGGGDCKLGASEGMELGNIIMPVGNLTTSIIHFVSSNQDNF